MSSLNSIGSQLSGFHMVNRPQDLDEASSGSTVSSHLVSSPASHREAGGADHFHIGSQAPSEAGSFGGYAAPQDNSLRGRAAEAELAAEVLEFKNQLFAEANLEMQNDFERQRSRTDRIESLVENLVGRVDVLSTDNEGLRTTNAELQATFAGRVSGFEAQFTRLREENQGLRRTSSERRLEMEQLQFEVQALNAGTERTQLLWTQHKETLEGQVRDANTENARLRGRVTAAESRLNRPKSDFENIAGAVNFLTNPLRAADNPALGAGKTAGFLAASGAASLAFPPALLVTVPLYLANGLGTACGVIGAITGTEHRPIEDGDIFKS